MDPSGQPCNKKESETPEPTIKEESEFPEPAIKEESESPDADSTIGDDPANHSTERAQTAPAQQGTPATLFSFASLTSRDDVQPVVRSLQRDGSTNHSSERAHTAPLHQGTPASLAAVASRDAVQPTGNGSMNALQRSAEAHSTSQLTIDDLHRIQREKYLYPVGAQRSAFVASAIDYKPRRLHKDKLADAVANLKAAKEHRHRILQARQIHIERLTQELQWLKKRNEALYLSRKLYKDAFEKTKPGTITAKEKMAFDERVRKLEEHMIWGGMNDETKARMIKVEMREEAMKKEALKKEALKKEAMEKEAMEKEAMEKEALKKQEIKKEETRKKEIKEEETTEDETTEDETTENETTEDESKKGETREWGRAVDKYRF